MRLGALRYGYRLSRCGQKLLTGAQFSVERLVRAPEGVLGAKLGAETTFPGLVPVQDVSLYIHTMEFFILWDISVFEIACQLLTLDKKNHTHVIPKGRMS